MGVTSLRVQINAQIIKENYISMPQTLVTEHLRCANRQIFGAFLCNKFIIKKLFSPYVALQGLIRDM